MADPRLIKLAQVLTRYSVHVRPGDRVGITQQGSIAAALPLQAELVREVLRSGGLPQPYVVPAGADEFDYIFFSTASESQLKSKDRAIEVSTKEFDCDITIKCETNTKRLSHIDMDRQTTFSKAHSELIQLFLDRAARGELRWVVTAVPTSAYAQDAEMSLQEYEDFLYSSTFTDADDPVSLWEAMGHAQRRLVEWLAHRSTVHVKGSHADITFSVDGRTFLSCDGRLNMPDGEIFTAPVEDSVNGWFETTYPAIRYGVDVGKVTLRLEHGLIARADAERNQAHLDKVLGTDEGSHRLGEFGIGTNAGIKAFTRNILFDEKIAGTIHFAAGLGYPETGSRNESSIHWDFICDMRDGGTITIDSQPFYDAGRFLV
jgi:aminopeptidase